MQITTDSVAYDSFTKVYTIDELDEKTRALAESRFAEYAARGVIYKGGFDDAEWKLSDEVKRRNIRFDTRDGSIQDWTGCSEECYMDYVRSYTALMLGTYTVQTVAEITKSLILLGCADFDTAAMWDIHTVHALQFLGMIPGSPGYVGAVMERIEENRTLDRWSRHPRDLSNFCYYLRFDRYVDDFWKTADSADKDTFFPVYLWWKLTSILPLRATEFLLLPSDCIHGGPGKRILTVRRTKMKKGGRKVGYSIAADYSLHDYEVPDWIADAILAYKKDEDKRRPHGKDTLFSPIRRSGLDYLTYDQMYRRLREFRELATGDERYPINLGDTRHLAMINLILSGGSPVICRELAGHESINISSAYYANLSTAVESAVYEEYRENRGRVTLEGSLKLRLGDMTDMAPVPGGRCDHAGIKNGDISECMKVFRTGEHFGDCTNCIHYYPDDGGLKLKIDDNFKKKVDEDGAFLMEMIEQVRRGNGAQEDIMSALLRLQNSGASYKKILERDRIREDKYGKA